MKPNCGSDATTTGMELAESDGTDQMYTNSREITLLTTANIKALCMLSKVTLCVLSKVTLCMLSKVTLCVLSKVIVIWQ